MENHVTVVPSQSLRFQTQTDFEIWFSVQSYGTNRDVRDVEKVSYGTIKSIQKWSYSKASHQQVRNPGTNFESAHIV